jgi:UDPglucose 6-dehydrogenase
MQRVAVVGAGYVGLTSAACFAELGHLVSVIDIDRSKLAGLREGRVPFHEPGLAELILQTQAAGALRFTDDYAAAVPQSEFAFIAVSTPPGPDGAADLSAVLAAAREIGRNLDHRLVVVNKSTVPIGTAALVAETVSEAAGGRPVRVASNPEFLREGTALHDFRRPSRIVVGADDRATARSVARLYRGLTGRRILTDVNTAEMIKYASNAFLATRVSFINEIARMAERLGADADVVALGMGLDRRIGRDYLQPGIGYGGSCLPKDVSALAAMASRFDYHPELLHSVMAINGDQRRLAVERLAEGMGGLAGRQVALLGLAFKAGTDDLRDAPSLEIAYGLRSRGAEVRAFDPAVGEVDGVDCRRDAYAALAGADGALVVTDWPEFGRLDPLRMARVMRQPVVVDGRGVFDRDAMRRAGMRYFRLGHGGGWTLPDTEGRHERRADRTA